MKIRKTGKLCRPCPLDLGREVEGVPRINWYASKNTLPGLTLCCGVGRSCRILVVNIGHRVDSSIHSSIVHYSGAIDLGSANALDVKSSRGEEMADE